MVESGHSKWLLLVSDQRDNVAVPFDHIIGVTPKELMKARGAGGVYDTVKATNQLGNGTRCPGASLLPPHLSVGGVSRPSVSYWRIALCGVAQSTCFCASRWQRTSTLEPIVP